MSGDAAQSAVVRKLARGSLISRLIRPGRKPLRLVAVPRDHVQGDRRRGDALLSGNFTWGSETLPLADLDFAAVGTGTPLADQLQGFSWLRDLAAAASREKGARLAEAIAGRWLLAHGTRVDPAWRPDLWGERILFWTAYAPYLLSSSDAGYRSALLNTLARGARFLEANADRAPAGLRRVTAWAGVVAASLLVQSEVSRVARAEAGLGRALGSAQFDDGGLVSRTPYEQALLVDRLALLRSAYFAAKHTPPEGLEAASAAALSALHGILLGDGAMSSWQGGNSGEPERLTAIVEGCGLRARPLRQPRGWGFHRLSALGTVVVMDAAPPPPPKAAPTGCASTLAFELSDGPQRLIVNCGGPAPLGGEMAAELATALRTTAAHSTVTVADTNSTAILADGALGKGVADVDVERTEDNDSSRIAASHDGYQRGFGLLHRRTLTLGNDGKELTGLDELLPKGRKRSKDGTAFAIRFHLAAGIEPTVTADGMGAILRSPGAPPWNFRSRGAAIGVEESLMVDGRGRPRRTMQLVINGEAAADGAQVQWQLRRSS
ncbi:MAG TPA: heparinase II/III family protein [Sphingomicrobium sp.]|nr:heparinase II/III family protein [Sphingomicrobium sp.]